jgi:hypothetical protein
VGVPDGKTTKEEQLDLDEATARINLLSPKEAPSLLRIAAQLEVIPTIGQLYRRGKLPSFAAAYRIAQDVARANPGRSAPRRTTSAYNLASPSASRRIPAAAESMSALGQHPTPGAPNTSHAPRRPPTPPSPGATVGLAI